ncbi:MAG: SGNH/GDSL hydrolase family protein [Bacteroidales bacterium]|nr:SGNH/GDSL hydrolase family protein [Bacteroidales bacterium]
MRKIIALAAAMICAAALYAQNADDREVPVAPKVVWTSADLFPVFGKCVENTSARYERLPAEYQGVSRDAIWYLGRHSAGIYVRFRSNSPSIHVRWTSTFKILMNHQTPTGTRGLDLYTIYDGKWRFVGSGRPNVDDKTSTQRIIGNMDGQMREYMLYLSLYDGVSSLEIGTEEGSLLEQPAVDRPSHKRPIVMYGTSILQGGCANRPGMTHTAIIGRRLDREVINLGFSGNALLDMEIAELMAKVEDPALYVMDYAPNAWDYLIREKGEQFFRIVRDAHPDVPVIFIEDVIFPHTIFDPVILQEVTKKNIAQRELFEKLKKQGEKQIYYIKAEGMIGDDGEATVDGCHFTDLGMMRYVDHVLPTIKKALRRAGK